MLEALVSSSSIHVSIQNWPGACRRDELEGTVLLPFVRHVWHEQTVLPEVEGVGLRELRARAVSTSREFCSVAALLSPVVCIGVGSGGCKEKEVHGFLSLFQ